MIAGVFGLLNVLKERGRVPYRFTVNGTMVRVSSIAELKEQIIPYFPYSVAVNVYSMNGQLLDALSITPTSLQAPINEGFIADLDREGIYNRLKMYIEPDMLDLFVRSIDVDQVTFSRFMTNLVSFNTSDLGDSARAVFLR